MRFFLTASGRGPAIITRIVLDPAGMPTEIDATGNDYLKAPVNEHFRMAGHPCEPRGTTLPNTAQSNLALQRSTSP